jgi:hypothetical protein
VTIVFVGIGLAKNVFAVRGVNESGEPGRVGPSVQRATPHELMALLPLCAVAMQARCSGDNDRLGGAGQGRALHAAGPRRRSFRPFDKLRANGWNSG